MNISYKMNRVKKGSRTFYYITIQGIRINNINYARKYDAERSLTSLIERLGVEGINEKMKEIKSKQEA